MKKLVLVLLAVFLVIPALSNAGSVSSRYDVTFGGFVKFDMAWQSENDNVEAFVPSRDSTTGRHYLKDDYSNTSMSGAETRLNFLVKGPDLWGAKTSAFIEGDFRGTSTGNQYGGFQLRHAFMTLNWQKAELMIGQNWQQWGMPYYPAALGFNDNGPFLKGLRLPQIAFRYFFTKEFNAMIGVQSATEWSGLGGVRGYNDGYARSDMPGIMGEIAYWSDRCGKIGPNNLKFGLGGFYGKEKRVWDAAGAPGINPQLSNTATSTVGFNDDETNSWMGAFRYSVPIIPEKQGNKQYALLLNGNVFYGQNWGQGFMGPTSIFGSSYMDGTDLKAPTSYGQFSQLSFWFTNNLWLNLQYGYLKYNYSSTARAALPNFVTQYQNYAANLMWDANAAIRFGVQWNHVNASYNASTGVAIDDRKGDMDIYRVAAWYFF